MQCVNYFRKSNIHIRNRFKGWQEKELIFMNKSIYLNISNFTSFYISFILSHISFFILNMEVYVIIPKKCTMQGIIIFSI